MATGRWVGIDEAGYGPNLGPLVMTAVVAEGERPDVWRDLEATVCRAGGRDGRLWVDDSKRVYAGGVGLDRLEAATLAMLEAIGVGARSTVCGLLAALGSGAVDSELDRWADGVDPPIGGSPAAVPGPLDGAPWRIAALRSVVLGPAGFNAGLTGSKALVHAGAFASLLGPVWEQARDGIPTFIRSDKHGGRHFYADVLVRACPGASIAALVEGPALSHYALTSPGRRLEVALEPRADAGDGLVALASMASKAVREHWMGVFNAFWARRIPGLRPTAGYPLDATRFRDAIGAEARRLGLDPEVWWRKK